MRVSGSPSELGTTCFWWTWPSVETMATRIRVPPRSQASMCCAANSVRLGGVWGLQVGAFEGEDLVQATPVLFVGEELSVEELRDELLRLFG